MRHVLLFVLLLMTIGMGKTCNIVDFGAVGDDSTINTKAIQAAIDRCTANGGGRVVIADGIYRTGAIYLKDKVTLYIENGAVLKGSPDYSDYATDTHRQMYKNEPHMNRCLIFARDAASFAIEGHGTIDGNGYRKYFNPPKTGRPMLMRFLNCRDIHLRDVTLINPAAWVSAWLYCDEIVVDGIRIHSRINGNGDGLDFDGCSNVHVSNSSFDTSDDSICLQASDPEIPCKDVVITNCIFKSKWAGMRIGLLSRGDFESVTVSNCTFRNIDDSGLKIQMNEGGEMKNMVFSNLVMKNVPRPVFTTFCQQRACVDAPEEMAPMDRMHGFIFSNIIVDNSELDKNSAFFITGMSGHDIEHVTIKDVQMTVSGGGTEKDAAREIKEYTLDVLGDWWPEFYLVGTLPAAGFYLRHVDGVHLENIQLFTVSDDARPPFVFDDVKNGRGTELYLNNKLSKILQNE